MMSNLSLWACLLAIVSGCAANIISPMVGGENVATAVTELHAVAVLAVPDATRPNNGRLGGGSIISRSRVLTAAHVIEGAEVVRVFFYEDDFTVETNRKSATSTYQQTIPKHDADTREFDLVVLLFAADTFPALNVIVVTAEAALPAAGDAASLAGYGYTSPDSVGPNPVPLLAPHTIADACGKLKVTESHFCALATDDTFVCPGDNGGGLFVGTGADRRLIGVLSRMESTRCEVSSVSAFASLVDPWVQGFMISQSVTPGVAP